MIRRTRHLLFLPLVAVLALNSCIDRDRPASQVWDGNSHLFDMVETTSDYLGDLPLHDGPVGSIDATDIADAAEAYADTATELDWSPDLEVTPDSEICVPECGDWECGDDGCGGQCGDCDDGLFCTGDTCIEGNCINAIIDGYCVILEQCFGTGDLEQEEGCLECRPAQDKTDWSFSDDGEVCGENLVCFQGSCCDASSACDGAECGSDGCGGSCGTCADPLDICFAGTCLCVPDCEGKTCGDGGCGTLCGICSNPQESCQNHECICEPDCADKVCGADGCGGTCGSCDDGVECTSDACVDGTCANLLQDTFCFIDDACITSGLVNPDDACLKCLPTQSQMDWTPLQAGAVCGEDAICFDGDCCPRGANCVGKICGDDGCGGTCGTCTGPQDACIEGLCACQPVCDGKDCGADGCGGLCGACDGGKLCEAGLCQCKPNATSDCCGDDVCWFDSCGAQGDVQASCPFGCVDATCANCVPVCEGLECGEDSCGGSCGTCTGFQQECIGQLCACVPACEGRECGGDGCGGSCGTCPGPQDACLAGVCTCKPACQGLDCGADGCGGLCGSCPGPQDSCLDGACICQPACEGKVCGPDGCGGSCGTCDIALTCVATGCAQGECTYDQLSGTCLIDEVCYEDGETNLANPCEICAPDVLQDKWSSRPDGIGCGVGSVCYAGDCCAAIANCVGKECGANGCGGSCGSCLGPQDVCANNKCVCIAACAGKACGPDGCGGTCGSCSGGKVCQGSSCVCVPEHHTDCCGSNVCWVDSCGTPGDQALTCQYGCANGECNNCTPNCAGKVCGGDGCGGSCGSCEGPQDLCVAGNCQCQPACDGMICGSDGCGEACGTCPGEQDVCIIGACICQPDCEGKVCGDDGCGGICGSCGGEQDLCVEGACICQPDCAGKQCGTDGCGSTCGSCDDELFCTGDICAAGLCKHNLKPSYCAIDDTCFLTGQTEPGIPCNFCDPAQSTSEWSILPDGKACGDGGVCYDSQCCPKKANCAGLECGDDLCGGTCGTCGAGFYCIEQLCVDPTICDDGNSVDWDGCTAGQVTEIKTNTHKWSAQTDPAVAVLTDGGYVIVWESKTQDSDGSYGVFGQLYDADGLQVGNEFKANSSSESDETDPDVAALAGGGFVVAWYTDNNDRVRGRLFNATGNSTTSEFTLSSYTSNTQEHPAVTGLSAGGFATVWDNDGLGDSQGVFMRLFDADGVASGSQSMVNVETADNQLDPDIAQLGSGDIVVVWTSKNQDGNAHGIFARRYDSSGTPLAGDEQVNTFWAGEQFGGRLVALTGGGYVVTWYRKGVTDSDGIYARRFDADGVAAQEQFQVNSTIPEKQWFNCVGALPDDGFISAWQSEHQDGSKWGVYYRRFDGSDQPLAADMKANIYTANEQQAAACAGFPDGKFIVVWESANQDGSDYGIFHQRYAKEGYRLYP